MSDARSQMIRLAHANPELRPLLLRLVKEGKTFPTPQALKTYLNEHPKADKSKHHVEKGKGKGKAEYEDAGGKDKGDDATLASEVDVKTFQGDIPEYNLKVIAGTHGKVTKGDLARATKVRDAIKKGISDSADVCKVSPSVCKNNKGITRDNMPQIPEESIKALLESTNKDGSPNELDRKKGKAAVAAGADPDDDTPMTQRLLEHLKKQGVKITEGKKIPVGKLKATQAEIKAGKTMGMADAFFKGKFDPTKKPIIVSKDGFILDGHHRWSSMLTADPNAEMNVIQIDMPMEKMLESSFTMPGVFRMDIQDNVVDPDKPLDLARKPGAIWKQKGGFYAKGKDGKSGGPFKGQDAAKAYATGQKADKEKPVKDKKPVKVGSTPLNDTYMDQEQAQALYDTIGPRVKVTIINRFGQLLTGVAVMRGPAGWVLNMGGAHGTPGIVSPANIVKVNGRPRMAAAGWAWGFRNNTWHARVNQGGWTWKLLVHAPFKRGGAWTWSYSKEGAVQSETGKVRSVAEAKKLIETRFAQAVATNPDKPVAWTPGDRMASDLRAATIRLAHDNPALRPHLLPLLAKQASGQIEIYPDLDVPGFKVVYPDPHGQTYDSYLAGMGNSATVKKLVEQALHSPEAGTWARHGSSAFMDWVEKYVSDKSKGRFTHVRWNMRSYPD